MVYRLDEGKGRCIYFIGVEDDGCHSMLDYATISESARILECIARSLNAVVLERKMIQNEIIMGEDGAPLISSDKDGVIVETEPPLFGNGRLFNDQVDSNEIDKEDEKEEKSAIDIAKTIRKEAGFYTRCELTVQRVETHLLDPSPVSLSVLAKKSSSITDGTEETKDATSLPTDSSGMGNANGSVEGSSPHGLELSSESTATGRTIGETKTDSGNDEEKPVSISETLSSRNIRVAVVGNVDAGKSTLIGTLTTSGLDDGRGRSRTSIMKHRHEIESGRTSTATSHLMGFRSNGEPIGGRDQIRANKHKTEDEVARESFRIVTLMDLAGHEKYLKTTIHGVSSGMSDYSLILVNSRHPPTHMTQHHLNLCCSFGIPVIVVFTKIDGCPEHAMKTSKQEVFKLLRAPDIGKKPFVIRKEQDIATCAGKLHTLAPVFDTSCVTGEGLDLLRKMLFSLPKRRRHENKRNRPFEFLVEDIFNVPGVGSVVSGFVNAGELSVGANSHVFVGPTDDGTFLKTVAKSAHIARINTGHITSGQSACLALSLSKDLRKKLRRGMVVLRNSPTSTREFDAEICVLKGEGTTIRRSYQAYVHILNVRQSAFAKNIEIINNNVLGLTPSHGPPLGDDDDGIVLRPGSRAKVRFEFAKRPEYIRPGMRMLFRDGRVRGVGIITGVPESTDAAQ
uniref:Elongation factor Tu, chloroplastic n=1 Tax=Ditylum brightwellii TaxID=49249 RepID=A0A6S8ZSZ9_9STRA|mmetsp:Transcript_8982/g.11966  ORF Transcript_8982/g.11966 Transcript_8982/m.11966 type:complete len:680 (+) Transcript_8982:553-2592(+)